MNFRERQQERFRSVKKSDSVGNVEKKHTKADSSMGSAGERHLFSYTQSRAANEGHHWADHDIGDEEGTFKHTVGMFPNVDGHVKCFEKAANASGGVNTPGFYTSDPASGVARADVKQFTPRYHIQGQTSGKTFEDRQKQRRSGNGGG